MTFLMIMAAVFAAEYAIKEYVNTSRLQGTRKELPGGRVVLQNVHNKGTALGWLKLKKEEHMELSAMVLGAVGGGFVSQLLHRGRALKKLGLSLILGGGISNYAERRKCGYVTDYVGIKLKSGNSKNREIVFNLADIAVVLGIVLWVISLICPSHSEKKNKGKR